MSSLGAVVTMLIDRSVKVSLIVPNATSAVITVLGTEWSRATQDSDANSQTDYQSLKFHRCLQTEPGGRDRATNSMCVC
jgi:hypothetical protein